MIERILVAVAERAHPAEAILEFAEASGSDAIAMGTHGRGGVARTLLVRGDE